jgi:hypothetical protein
MIVRSHTSIVESCYVAPRGIVEGWSVAIRRLLEEDVAGFGPQERTNITEAFDAILKDMGHPA